VDEEIIFKRIMKAVTLISLEHDLTIYFPIHPRTKKNLSKFNIEIDEKRIKLLEPVGYLEMLVLEQHAK
jgi:UDP-N-acetylglucosamine 2-epimerase (non-hydrolysing)